MLNQGQGTYPQLAGSFYNSQQMMPHDNGRNARQVPTFFGGLQNMMSASTAMANYQGMPLNQNILSTQALATNQYNSSMANVIGGLGTGASIAGLVGGVGTMAAGVPGLGFLGTGLLGKTLGIMAGAPLAIAGGAGMMIMSGYKKRMAEIEDMRAAMEASRLGYGLADPVTGNLTSTAALQLSRQIESSQRGSGFQGNDLKTVMGQASGLGMLNGMQSLGEVTKRVTDLAKASREIVMLGEGITMSDAMQLQKLTQDMGISTSKFRGMNIGKNLVMAARASNMSLDGAAQIAGMGATTFQQIGLGAASGMNAALHTNLAAAGLTGVGAFNTRQLAALGGQQGIAQALLGGQASTMARMSDTLVMGAVKLRGDGQFRIDRDLLDRYVRGDVSAKEMMERGKNIGKDMSKGDRSKLLEALSFQMPELREQMSDMLSSEEMMTIQGRGILELQRKTGLSMRRATHAYFQDANQAEAFLGYSKNYRATRAEMDRQERIADQERLLKRAGMSSSTSGIAVLGRGIVHAAEAAANFVSAPFIEFGDILAEDVTQYQDDEARALRRMMGVRDYRAGTLDIGSQLVTRGEGGNARGTKSLLDYDFETKADHYSSIEEEAKQFFNSARVGRLETQSQAAIRANQEYLERIQHYDGLNTMGNTGLGQAYTEAIEGEYNALRKLGDFTGLDFFQSANYQREVIMGSAKIADDAEEMRRLMLLNTDASSARVDDKAYYKVLSYLKQVGLKAKRGDRKDVRDIFIAKLREQLEGGGLSQEQQDLAISKALKTARDFEGDAGVGLSDLLKKKATVAGLMTRGFENNVKGELDKINLGGGNSEAYIESKGLSAAIAQSNLKSADLNKLVRLFATNKDIANRGTGVDSVQAIMREAKISPSDYSNQDMKGIAAVIKTLRNAQITRGGGEDKKTVSLAGSYLSDDTTNIQTLFLNANQVADQANLVAQRELEALQSRITANLGGGKNLIKGLQDLRKEKKLTSFSSLSEMLNDIAGDDREDQDAFKRLLTGNEALRSAYQQAKVRMDEASTDTEKSQIMGGLMEKIARVAESATTPEAGKGKSRDLGKVLDTIAGGIDAFTKTMTDIGTLTASKGSIVITGPNVKVTKVEP